MENMDHCIIPNCKKPDQTEADYNPEVGTAVFIKNSSLSPLSMNLKDFQRVMLMSAFYSKIKNNKIQEYINTVKANKPLSFMNTNESLFREVSNRLLTINPREFVSNYIEKANDARQQLLLRIERAVIEINEPSFLHALLIQKIAESFKVSLRIYTSKGELLEFTSPSPINIVNIYAKYGEKANTGCYGIPVSNEDVEEADHPYPIQPIKQNKIPESMLSPNFMETCDLSKHTNKSLSKTYFTTSYCITERKFLCEDCEDMHPKLTKGQIINWNKRNYEWSKKKDLQDQIELNIKKMREQKLALLKEIEDRYRAAEANLRNLQKYSLDENQVLRSEMTHKGLSATAFNDIFQIHCTETEKLHKEYDAKVEGNQMLLNNFYQKISDSQCITQIVEKVSNLFMLQQ